MKPKQKKIKKILNAGSHTITGILTVSLLLFISAFPVFGQTETGQISGEVKDPQGAVVPRATVTAKSLNTRAERRATTSDSGRYTIANLQPGLYDVTVEALGFAPITKRAQVTVGAKVALDVELSIQAVGEEVTIVAGESGVQVNTQSQELSTVVSGKQVVELPTLTRNPYALVAISGNVSPADPSGRGVGFSINGQRAASTNILLDGGENNDTFTASVGQSVPLDSVQEFSILTSNFSAEFGRAAGGIVNVATKAGTNSFHGSVYEFNRVSALASNSFNSNANELPKGVFTRNQFGYSVGGPVIKEKLFFFNSIEWIRVRSSQDVIRLVPTPEFIARTSANTRNFLNAFQLVAPISGGIVRRSDLVPDGPSPFASLPGNLPVFGEVVQTLPIDAGGGLPQNSYQLVGRVDFNLSDKTLIYGRYALEDQSFLKGTNANSPYDGFNTGAAAFNNNFLISMTHSFSPNLVSQSKVVYNRLNGSQPLAEQAPGPTLYLRAARTSINGRLVALPGYLPFNPGSAIPFGGPQNLVQFHEDVNNIRGAHNLRFGGTYVYIQDNRTFGAYQNSVETLGNGLAQALDNLVAGQLLSFAGAVFPQGKFPGETLTLPVGPPQFSRSNRYHEFALYVNDSWKARPNLTLNLGLRYEYFGVQHNSNPRLESNFYFGQGATFFERLQNGKVQIAEDSPVGGLWKPDWNNFAPRVGFAWDIFGDGNTSFRGGYGIAYERNFGNVTFNVIQNPPNYAVVSLVAGVDVPSIPITLNNAGPLAGTGTKVLPRTSLRHVDENIVNAYSHFWSAALERKVLRGVASLEYSGSKGVDLYDLTDPNRPGTGNVFLGIPCAPGACASRINTQYSNFNTRGNQGFSNYNSLTLGYETPLIRKLGLQFTARHTWSHAIDNLSSTFSESNNNFNLGLLDPFNPDLDKGDADFDIRHRFTSSFIWEIPTYRSQEGFIGKLLGGWSVNGLFTARTGAPFTIFDCSNAQFAVCIRAQQTGAQANKGSDNPGPDTTSPSTPNRFNYLPLNGLTPGLFVNPITGNSEFGPFPANMTGRNAFRRPGFWDFDMGLFKKVTINERYSIQLRGEFFNIFNHANLFINDDETDISTLNFVPAFRDGRRNIQLALKFLF